MKAKFERISRAIEKLIKKRCKGINRNYNRSYKRIRRKLRRLYDEYEVEGQVSIDDLRRFKELERLDALTTQVVISMFKDNEKLIDKILYDIADKTRTESIRAMDSGIIAIDKQYNAKDIVRKRVGGRVWVERVEHRASNANYDVNSLIRAGMERGDSYTQIARDLKGKLAKDNASLNRLVRTEGSRVVEDSKYSTFEEIAKNPKIEVYKIWHTMSDERVRSSHQAMEGVKVKMDEEFTLPSGATCLYPKTTGYAEEDINCRCYVEYVTEIKDKEVNPAKEVSPAKEIIKGLPDISEIKTDEDRKKFAEKVVENMGIDTSNINISVGDADGSRGFCQLSGNTTDDTLQYKRYVLDKDDGRSVNYKIKTAFHEAFHLRATGLDWDGRSYGLIDRDWLALEETFTESAAHYLMSEYGIKEKLAPAYPTLLGKNLPRLKQLDKYAKCKTINDFGEIALDDRLNDVGAKWLELYDEMNKKKVGKDYYSQYFDYIEKNKDSLFDLMFENSPKWKDYRDRLEEDLENAMNTDLKDLTNNEEFAFYSIITCAMQKVGVK